jgi:hypothetical protein
MIDLNIFIHHESSKPDFRAKSLQFSFSYKDMKFKGQNMTFTLASGQESLFTVAPLLADGVTPSLATLSNLAFNTGGPFVVVTSVTANSGILQCPSTASSGVADTLVGTATATEPDGVTTEQVSGVVSLVVGTGPTPPPSGVATSLGFTFGPAQPIGTNSKKLTAFMFP